MNEPQNLIIGISGASGMPYGADLIRTAWDAGLRLHIVVSPHSLAVIKQETGHVFESAGDFDPAVFCGRPDMDGSDRIRVLNPMDMTAGPASGTFPCLGMVMVPCSMRTLGALAGGMSDNLLLRAADCQLKEGRKLVLVPRETPFSLIHLENMTRLARAGATILPPMPAYYYHPKSLADHEHFITSKICDQLGIEPSDPIRWGDGG